ncbi:MAG: ATP-binding cassette domain-containing protein [Micrococcales bacterium]|nr:ATP-binding cassette domain-containing protein [Micrococcales bacterium]
MDTLLELVDVTKRYRGGTVGVDSVDLRLGPGLLGLLGPNGAGKSSLLRIAATVTRPTSGRLLFGGADAVRHPDALRRALGYLPQDFGVYPHLSAVEFLAYLAAVKGVGARAARARIGGLLELLDLSGTAKRPLGSYSGGMLRRVGIAQALLTDPLVLVVDEPSAGLDPEQRVVLRNLLSDLAATRLVVLSTHIASDVESVAADIAIMAGGRIVTRGTPERVRALADGRTWEATLAPEAVAELRTRCLISKMVRSAQAVTVRMLSDGTPIPGAVPVAPDLEDAYLVAVHAGGAGGGGSDFRGGPGGAGNTRTGSTGAPSPTAHGARQ